MITVCSGHGGGKPGNTWGGVHEADLMTELRFLVALKLRESGQEVVEDGGRGENLSLSQAIQLIHKASLAIELHTNASDNPTAEGVEVISMPAHRERSQKIAKAIGGTLMIPTRRDQGWWDYTKVGRTLGFAAHGGLIVEVFFQSNPSELRKYQQSKWLVASAIARAALE